MNETYYISMDNLAFDNPVIYAVRTYAAHQGMDPDHPDVLKAVILELHRHNKRLEKLLGDADFKARMYDLMTEGIEVDGKRLVFVPPKKES